jgi:hypothetical protein
VFGPKTSYGAVVLAKELELADLDARHWRNWWELLVPPRVLADPRWAIVVVEGTPAPPRAVRVVIAGAGAVEPVPPLPGLDEASLGKLARALGVDAVVAIDRRVIAAVAKEVEAALSYDQDLVEQGVIALRALKRRAGKGIWTAPALLELVPAPPFEGLQRTFDLLVPDKSALLAYVIDDDRRSVHASIIAVKRGGDIVRAATHRAIAGAVDEARLAKKWETEYERVLDAVEKDFAKPAIGLFLERATLMRVVTGPSDQLARELNAKRVVIDPAPAWLLGLLGGATVAAMATRGARALASMLPQAARERAADLAQRAGTAIRESGPFAQLGFDPIELWARLKRFYR